MGVTKVEERKKKREYSNSKTYSTRIVVRLNQRERTIKKLDRQTEAERENY